MYHLFFSLYGEVSPEHSPTKITLQIEGKCERAYKLTIYIGSHKGKRLRPKFHIGI